jgi:hypothetical protein
VTGTKFGRSFKLLCSDEGNFMKNVEQKMLHVLDSEQSSVYVYATKAMGQPYQNGRKNQENNIQLFMSHNVMMRWWWCNTNMAFLEWSIHTVWMEWMKHGTLNN